MRSPSTILSRLPLRPTRLGGIALGLLLGCGGGAEPEDFMRLKLEAAGGPCMEEMDCMGWDEVLADGTFRVDRFGEPGGGVHEAVLSQEEMKKVREAATRPELLSLLRRGKTPCGTVSDSSNLLTLELEGTRYRAQLAGCDAPGWRELHGLLTQLRETHVP